MLNRLDNSHIGMVGGGRFCLALLKIFFSENFGTKKPNIIGVADLNPNAVGMVYAREKDIFTTTNYKELFKLEKLDLIIELAKDVKLGEDLKLNKPAGVQVVDYFEAGSLLQQMSITAKKQEMLKKIRRSGGNSLEIESLLDEFCESTLQMTKEQDAFIHTDRKDLVAGEKALFQAIQGNTIPTFLIDKNHMVTHWNRACEKLTGYSADLIVGTNDQWKPFRSQKRPIMADLILDGVKEEEVWRYYGTKWKKSDLIDGAFEAEEYFEHLGDDGKWLFFTAAPIKNAQGITIGAIETLQDKTEEKRTQAERRKTNQALTEKTRAVIANQQIMSQIIQGSTIPTFVIDVNHVITHWNKALENLTGLPANKMVGTRDQWKSFYDQKRPSMADVILDQVSEREIQHLYGTKWKKSVLLEEAYEAEVYFPGLGNGGKWCFFTAAPIRSPDGEIIGAIETIWDKTEEKKAEADRERQNAELALRAKELRASEKTMAQIIQGSTIPTFVINKDHIVTHWNRACEKLTGFSADEIIGTDNHWKPSYDEKRPTLADLILDKAGEEEFWRLYGTQWKKSELIRGAYEAEEYFGRLEEEKKWIFFTAAPITDPDGIVVGAIETILDRTDEKLAEEERERRNRELATLCSIYARLSAPLGLEGRIKNALQKVTDIFSFDSICVFTLAEDGKFYLKYSHGQYGNLCDKYAVTDKQSMVFKVAQTNQFEVFEDITNIQNDEIVVMKQDGFQSLAYIPLVDKEKKAFGVIRAGSRQIKQFTTEDQHVLTLIGNRMGVAIENSILQEEIRRKANFQSRLINCSNNGIVATDANWNIVLFNPEAERIFGYTRTELTEKMNAKELLTGEVIQSIEEKISIPELRHLTLWKESTIRTRTGEQVPVNYSATPLFEHDREMGSVFFFQDLTEIKKLEHELINSERLAAIGQTVAGMAHGIKNILAGFKGGRYLVDIGIDKNNTDKLINGWEMIKRNIDQTSDLVMDLLTYSKEREPEYQNCFPNDIADDVCELVNEMAIAYGIAIVKDLSTSIGEVSMDPNTVHQCLLNFLSNAIDACIFDDNIEKKHEVSVLTKLEGETTIRFEVSDNGSGMSEDVKSKLFSSFFSTKGAKGTGLGLLVTRKLIEEHQGNIDVESELAIGTRFIMKLPFKPKGSEGAATPS
jgi:PAS domain S-box-containing protein